MTNDASNASAGPCKAHGLLAEWMRENNITSTSDLSRRLGITWSTARGLVSGTSRPDIDTAIRVRDLAGVPLDAWELEGGEVRT